MELQTIVARGETHRQLHKEIWKTSIAFVIMYAMESHTFTSSKVVRGETRRQLHDEIWKTPTFFHMDRCTCNGIAYAK